MTDTPTLDIARAVEEVTIAHGEQDAALHIAAAIACAVDPSLNWAVLDPPTADLYRAIQLRKPRTEPLADPDETARLF